MKRIIFLLVVAMVVFVAVERQRLFLRDPLATVTRDGVKQSGVTVMINYSNDVLLNDASGGRRRMYIVQEWNKVAATPTGALKCFNGMACLTDADKASAEKIGVRGTPVAVTMTNKRVEFADEDGKLVVVELR